MKTGAVAPLKPGLRVGGEVPSLPSLGTGRARGGGARGHPAPTVLPGPEPAPDRPTQQLPLHTILSERTLHGTWGARERNGTQGTERRRRLGLYTLDLVNYFLKSLGQLNDMGHKSSLQIKKVLCN